MADAARSKLTVDDYLTLEVETGVRHEFFQGEAVAMAGGTVDHGQVIMNLTALLLALAKPKGCRVLGSDVRLLIEETGLVTYPDVAVYGDPKRAKDLEALTNPVVLAEVLSPSTRNYDRGDKFDHYRSLPSLRFVLFVEVERQALTLARRTDAAWELLDITVGTVSLGQLGEVQVAELYEGVELP